MVTERAVVRHKRSWSTKDVISFNISKVASVHLKSGLNWSDMTKDAPLDIAAKEGRTAAVAALIAAGAPVDHKDARGSTPLIQAMAAVDDHARRKRFPAEAQARYLEIVRTLLAGGAKVHVKFYEMSPLSLAKSAKCEPLIKLLEEA
jgi:ankyrin repeat protein